MQFDHRKVFKALRTLQKKKAQIFAIKSNKLHQKSLNIAGSVSGDRGRFHFNHFKVCIICVRIQVNAISFFSFHMEGKGRKIEDL